MDLEPKPLEKFGSVFTATKWSEIEEVTNYTVQSLKVEEKMD